MTSRLGLLSATFFLAASLVPQLTTLVVSAGLIQQSTADSDAAQPEAAVPVLATKDPAAATLAQRSLTAMSGANGMGGYRDSIMTGTLTLGADKPRTFSVVIKSLGTRQVRVELSDAEGTRVRTLSAGQAFIQYPNGKIRKMLMNNTVPERVSHLPIFSLLAETSDATVIIENVGTSKTADGGPADVIALRPIPVPGFTQQDLDATTTKTLFYINQASGLVTKTEYLLFAETNPRDTTKVETYFSDFRLIDGVQVAFHQVTYEDGKLTEDLRFDTAKFNVGLSDIEFVLPQEVANAQ
jgi:hypothetical protein